MLKPFSFSSADKRTDATEYPTQAGGYTTSVGNRL